MKNLLFFLRVSIGWIFFYSGIIKVLNPQWTAVEVLVKAETLPDLFSWFALPANIAWVNLLNQWGLVLIGASLILGIFVRWGALVGVILMSLYYLVNLSFPYTRDGFLIDHHIVYVFVLLILSNSHSGRHWGIDGYLKRR